MKTIIISALTCILLLSMVAGYELFSGDTIEIELDKAYEYYSIVGNTSAVELTLQESGNFINVTVGDYVNTSFELVFFDREKKVITIYSGGGGGGTRTRYVDRNNTQFVHIEKIIYKNQTEEVPTDIEPIVKENKVFFYLFLGVTALLIVLLIVLFFNMPDFPINDLDERRDLK